MFEIFILYPKIQLWFPEKIVDFLGEKLVKMLGFCQNWIFGQKFEFSNSVENRRGKYSEFFFPLDKSDFFWF